MPQETSAAIEWALQQTYVDELGIEYPVTKNDRMIVNFVRTYFNDNDIEYDTFSYLDLEPYF